MPKPLKFYIHIMDLLNKGLGYLLAIMLAIMTIVIFAQVFCRYVLGDSLLWSEELSRYIMVWGVFIGSALAVRYHSLISLEVLPQRLPKNVANHLRKVVYLVVVVFCYYLFTNGMEMTQQVTMQKSAALRLSMAIPYSSVPIGTLLIFLNTVVVFIESLWKGEEA
ncbi:TRAP transporter small permease [Ammoniphilus resinae]|uniref:TRAP-type C4-dicarboxylate transport system permease small subunit n=1 Tax=Ammoniphilus resinae TaxID=861532 RepID=A0ABS4GIQ9_9BACL|nr:TRAP transporter small permease [Ammoniphilus resinae]MBP1930143.1 TRAP-type C4-dicarboxylate transport system permease small subunit [Ammoniphilus resinae]